MTSVRPLVVAVLGSESVDVTTINLATLWLGPADAPHRPARRARASAAVLRDVDYDGRPDLIVRFRTQETGIVLDDTKACLRGQIEAAPFEACDAIEVRL